jgi:alginate O-acetyltransferase complex protein AlgI
MLFNSFEFLLLFLPVAISGFYFLALFRRLELVLLWLIACSLFFHGFWKASYTWLFVVSMLVNYALSLGFWYSRSTSKLRSVLILVVGLTFNLLLLGYFKYAIFFAGVANDVTGYSWDPGEIILPLAISFYTFQQIAYLVDCYRGDAPRYSLLQYVSYLAFFPHLIAGPIVQHRDLVAQLNSRRLLIARGENFLCGITIIWIGLFKKVMLADGAAAYANPLFSAAAAGTSLTFTEAWMAALLFSFVIYFDFSGYSDMAIGLARLFNVKFPENFASPYKAVNIVEFWRRWNITLSRFLRDYLYIPLGGNRRGVLRRYGNILITMLLGGLWHGAGWTFLIWGGLHGVYLVVAHLWLEAKRTLGLPAGGMMGRIVGRVLTFIAVVVAWVFFRSGTSQEAFSILSSMAGVNGLSLPSSLPVSMQGWIHSVFGTAISFQGLVPHADLPPGPFGIPELGAVSLCVALLIVVNVPPNTQQIMRLFRPVLHDSSQRLTALARLLVWRPTLVHAAIGAALGMYGMAHLESVKPFIYFRF